MVVLAEREALFSGNDRKLVRCTPCGEPQNFTQFQGVSPAGSQSAGNMPIAAALVHIRIEDTTVVTLESVVGPVVGSELDCELLLLPRETSHGAHGIDGVGLRCLGYGGLRDLFLRLGAGKDRDRRAGSVFVTRDGSEIILKPQSLPGLPPAIQEGATVREIIWGTEAEPDLESIADELSRDRDVITDPDGALHSVDDLGLGIAFRPTRRRPIEDSRQPMNSLASPGRVDARATYHDRARPTHVGHCVFMAPDIARMEAFYTERLGFHVSDYYTGRGVFMRATPRGGHHNLFYLESADGKAAINHVAFGVEDVHELFAGGNHFQGKGYSVQIGPGRHHISSCYFWYFECPAGGATEYFCDEDYLTESWKPGNWDPAPETFAEWVIPEV